MKPATMMMTMTVLAIGCALLLWRRRSYGLALCAERSAVAAAVMGGAHIVRVHAVKAMVDVVRTVDAMRDAGRATRSP